jgi:hypothetical protein
MKLNEITLDWLLDRVVERDECLIWIRAIGSQSNSPEAAVDGRHWQVRRLIWTLVHGREVPKRKYIGLTCENPHCVHPDHVVAQVRGFAQRGRARTADERMRISLGRRANSALSDAEVDTFRFTSESSNSVADRLGIHYSYVNHIRAGNKRVDHRNPFAGLGQ